MAVQINHKGEKGTDMCMCSHMFNNPGSFKYQLSFTHVAPHILTWQLFLMEIYLSTLLFLFILVIAVCFDGLVFYFYSSLIYFGILFAFLLVTEVYEIPCLMFVLVLTGSFD